jgi:hypothetical protein
MTFIFNMMLPSDGLLYLRQNTLRSTVIKLCCDWWPSPFTLQTDKALVNKKYSTEHKETLTKKFL